MEPFYIGFYEFASPEYDESVALRHEVLRAPLGLEYTAEQLALEYSDIHIGLWDDAGLQATLILTPLGGDEIKMRQVAVRPQFQGRGLGSRLVDFSESWAKSKGYEKMVLHARLNAVPFYEKLAYDTIGGEFTEVGIPHYRMEKHL